MTIVPPFGNFNSNKPPVRMASMSMRSACSQASMHASTCASTLAVTSKNWALVSPLEGCESATKILG